MRIEPISQQPYHPPLLFRAKEIATAVVQLAVRLLFVVGTILATASALPLHLHAWVIPAVAIGATTLAAFFFPKSPQLDLVKKSHSGNLFIQPINVSKALAEGLGAEAPRGLSNGLNNCAFNSVLSCLQRIPQIAAWARTLTKGIDMTGLEQFLADYETPQRIVEAFRAFVDAQPHRRPPLRELFQDFLQDPIWNDSRALKETYTDLLPLQCALADFFVLYDEAVRNNWPVSGSNTQGIRAALSQITNGLVPNTPIQVDAGEILGHIFSRLPPRMMMRVSETYRYDTRGLPQIRDNPEGVTRTQEQKTILPLVLPKEEFSPHLEKVFQRFLCNVTDIKRKNVHGKDTVYPTTALTEFLEFPPCMWIQLMRFDHDEARRSVLTWFQSWIWPEINERQVKLHTPVQIPNELPITLATGEKRTYRLAAFVNHWGEYGSGHYTADWATNGHKYHIDDTQVTVPDQAEWKENLQKAYLLCYLPVQA